MFYWEGGEVINQREKKESSNVVKNLEIVRCEKTALITDDNMKSLEIISLSLIKL